MRIDESGYRPETVRVLVGGTVTWINQDPDQWHTAQTQSREAPSRPWDDEGDFDTRSLTWREPYTVTFTRHGTFEYFCSFEPYAMTGTVEVVEREPPQKAVDAPGSP